MTGVGISRMLIAAAVALMTGTVRSQTFYSDSVPPPERILPTEQSTDTVRSAGHESVGLVLSGGGAKGIAHVGVIKALEDNDIPIDYVTGTSMGAIVGSLYSCGWSPERMMSLFTSSDFGYWLSLIHI